MWNVKKVMDLYRGGGMWRRGCEAVQRGGVKRKGGGGG
jgi:hypothetical protein